MLDIADVSPILEIGSSTFEFRTVRKPHINELLHKPLRERNIRIVHADYKPAEGVDIVGDIFDPSVQKQMRDLAPKTVFCCNVFEHVKDKQALACFCDSIVPKGGYIVFSGPYSYPYHSDPIDNGFRPKPEEVAAMFPNFTIMASDIVRSTSFGADLLAKKSQLAANLIDLLVRLLKIQVGPRKYIERNHRLLWLFRRYSVTCVILRKIEAGTT